MVRPMAEASWSTLGLALTQAPSNGMVVYSSATYSMDSTDGSETTSLQMTIEKYFASDRFLMLGGYLDSLTLKLGPGEIPRASFSWSFADWKYAADAATDFSNDGALALASYANNKTLVQKASQVRQQTVGTSTFNSASILDVPAIEWALNIKFERHRTPGGVNTVKQPIRVPNTPVVSGSFTLPFEDMTWETARDNRTVKALVYQIGMTTTDGCVVLDAPTVQIKKCSKVSVDGITGTKVDWIGRLDAATSGSTDLTRSAARIALI